MYDVETLTSDDEWMVDAIAEVTLTKRIIGCTETVHVHAYEDPRVVVSTYPRIVRPDGSEMPALIKERHVGRAVEVRTIYDQAVAELIADGWTEQTDAR